MELEKKAGREGYIVCYKVDPNATPAARGYVIVDPEDGQYYHGPLDDPDAWTPLGQSPKPRGKKFPKNEPFAVMLCSKDNSMQLAWVVAYAPRPAEEYKSRELSPFKDNMLRNKDGELVRASERPDRKGHYHYNLMTENIRHGGRFLFSIYATIIAGNGAGKAFTVDPEMEVSETIDGGGN